MTQTLQMNIRVARAQWERPEAATEGREVSANQLVVELAMEALDRRELFSAEAEIRVARLALRSPGPRPRPDRRRARA